MTPTRQGSIRLFRFAGIEVYLNWLWFLAPVYFVGVNSRGDRSLVWPVLECLALFLIVLLHEFGHALACRQVGGRADLIVLWPLGGVAYVAPPPRPGATLWSIAAGPLVNVALVPILAGLVVVAKAFGLAQALPKIYMVMQMAFTINLCLLIFNMLPIYPLDGGQILQSLLWFVFGRARSLMVATIIGFIGVIGLIGVALLVHDTWLVIMCVFIVLMCWRGLMQARVLARIAKLPRRGGLICPTCRQAPIIGPIWRCPQCAQPFDIFASPGVCPQCGARVAVIPCPECGSAHRLDEWTVAGPQAVPPKFSEVGR